MASSCTAADGLLACLPLPARLPATTCSADILFPYVPHNDGYDLMDILHRDACPFGKVPWEDKVRAAWCPQSVFCTLGQCALPCCRWAGGSQLRCDACPALIDGF